MSGTQAGNLKVAATLKAKNPNHFREIGSLGGKATASGITEKDLDKYTFIPQEQMPKKPSLWQRIRNWL